MGEGQMGPSLHWCDMRRNTFRTGAKATSATRAACCGQDTAGCHAVRRNPISCAVARVKGTRFACTGGGHAFLHELLS